LFWTAALPEDSVEVDFDEGSAEMSASNVHVIDFGNIGNALFGGGPAPIPATTSFRVRWTSGSGEDEGDVDPVHIADANHAGEFVTNTAQMEWSATVGPYHFVSDPIDTSSSAFAEIGRERNGIFLSEDD